MTETQTATPPVAAPPVVPAVAPREDHFKKTIAVLIAVVTTLIAVASFLQSDAANRDDQANRDSKRYSLEAMGRKVSGDARVNYDYNKAYQAYYELGLLAASADAAGDTAAAQRYEALQKRVKGLSPLLAAPYFDEATGEPNVDKYEAEVYVKETTALMERFAAASVVKDAWDYKANTYIIHITLLAVALFLFGMSVTVSGRFTRWLFVLVGLGVTATAVAWVVTLYLQPVPDLRNCKTADGVYAIDAYVDGVGLAYQGDYQPAVSAFDKALACEPKYVNALVERGNANAALEKHEAAAADYEQARAAGDGTPNTSGTLAWTYYLLGRFDDASNMNREALKAGPDEVWIQFDLALSLLAGGQADAAKAEYERGMQMAAKQVADAKAAGKEPPSDMWQGLEWAAGDLTDLLDTLDTGGGLPARDKISNPGVVKTAAAEFIPKLKSLAVALEYTGQPPQGELKAAISAFQFYEPQYDENGDALEPQAADTFAYGADEVAAMFDYAGMQAGQDYVFKVYIDGEEDPSWRLIDKWPAELGASGTAEKTLSFAYSNVQVLRAGTYTVELYVDYQLAQSGQFVIEEEAP